MPPLESKNFANKLQQAGIKVRTLEIPDRGHFWFNIIPGLSGGTLQDYPNTTVTPQVLHFLQEELNEQSIGNFSSAEVKKIIEMAN